MREITVVVVVVVVVVDDDGLQVLRVRPTL